ncbi:MAG: hypothetical protein SWH78_09715 [Thermodesulfobacteriota bacterium]|nr:hypothetical protein [Thermodesulfobacteriota bacterium]
MSAHVAPRCDASDNRRSGKDRRRHIDPRYRNAAYLGFIDRRKGQRRQPVYEDTYPLIREHPVRRWTTRIGAVVALLFVYLLLFTNVIVCKRVAEGTDRKCTITIGCGEYDGHHERSTSAT